MDEKGRFVIDVDAHYYEDIRSFARYLSEPWKTRFISWTGQWFTPPGGTGATGNWSGGRVSRSFAPGLTKQLKTQEQVLDAMTYLGVDAAVLLPESLLALSRVTEKRRAVEIANGFMDSVLDTVADAGRGLYVLIPACVQNPKACAELINRVGKEPSVCGIVMMTDCPRLPFGDDFYDPIYRAALLHDLPLVFHSGFGGPEGTDSGFGLQSYAENHFAFVLNNQIQLLSIVYQGVPERFPGLRMIWEEAGVFWIPEMMYRLDTEYSFHRSEVTILKKPPSEYIAEFYFGTQPIEVVPNINYLKYIFEMSGGADRFLFATDWPHPDFDSAITIDRLTFLSAEEKEKVLARNALQALRFKSGKALLAAASQAAR